MDEETTGALPGAAGVSAALACAGELDADPGPVFWPAYFARSPGAYERMSHMDEYMQGRMLASVFDLLLAEDAETQRVFLRFEIGNHDAYGADQPMYEALFATLHQALVEICGDAWQGTWDQAWRERSASLLEAIEDVSRRP